MVHRGKEYFTRTAVGGLAGPGEEFAVGRAFAAVGRHDPAVPDRPGVDRRHDELRAVFGGDGVDQCGVGHGGAVEGDLVGPGVEQPPGVVDRRDAAPDGERDVDARGDARDQFGEGPAALLRGADVEVDQFVGPFGGVFRAEFHGVADLFQLHEVDSFDGLAFADVEAGDYAFRKHRSSSLRVMRPS